MLPTVISYDAFVLWAKAKEHRGQLILLGRYLIELEVSEDLVHRWRLLRVFIDPLVLNGHLQAMLDATRDGATVDVEKEQAAILKAVNEPIDTAAKVTREVRDEAWLRRIHDALCALVRILDDGLGVLEPTPLIETEPIDSEQTDPPAE